MNRTDEKGVALILVMIMLAVLSVIAASLMAVSSADTASSMNYRLMTAARYGAETAVHRAANYLMSDAYRLVEPGTAGDPLTNYNMAGTPDSVTNLHVVTYGGAPVRLSHDPDTFNYPGGFDGDVGEDFLAASTGRLAGTYAVDYRAVATLVSMRRIDVFGGGTRVVQTWKITGEGLMPGTAAAIDVSAILERQVAPVFSYAAFATSTECAALEWKGTSSTDSYDSRVSMVPDPPLRGGNVGTNGNLTLIGSAEIHGTLSTIRPGTAGSCAAGNALTGNLANLDGPIVQLPQPVIYPPPAPPTSLSSVAKGVNPGDTLTLDPGDYGDLDIKGTLILKPNPSGGYGMYNINSIEMGAQAAVRCPLCSTAAGGVILNVAGYGTAGVYEAVPSRDPPIKLTATTSSNIPSGDASLFVIQYAGTKEISLTGASGSGTKLLTGLIYAPNAIVKNAGTVDWYGAVIGSRVLDWGTAAIHYDRALSNKALMLGNWMMDSFTWRKF